MRQSSRPGLRLYVITTHHRAQGHLLILIFSQPDARCSFWQHHCSPCSAKFSPFVLKSTSGLGPTSPQESPNRPARHWPPSRPLQANIFFLRAAGGTIAARTPLPNVNSCSSVNSIYTFAFSKHKTYNIDAYLKFTIYPSMFWHATQYLLIIDLQNTSVCFCPCSPKNDSLRKF